MMRQSRDSDPPIRYWIRPAFGAIVLGYGVSRREPAGKVAADHGVAASGAGEPHGVSDGKQKCLRSRGPCGRALCPPTVGLGKLRRARIPRRGFGRRCRARTPYPTRTFSANISSDKLSGPTRREPNGLFEQQRRGHAPNSGGRGQEPGSALREELHLRGILRLWQCHGSRIGRHFRASRTFTGANGMRSPTVTGVGKLSGVSRGLPVCTPAGGRAVHRPLSSGWRYAPCVC